MLQALEEQYFLWERRTFAFVTLHNFQLHKKVYDKLSKEAY